MRQSADRHAATAPRPPRANLGALVPDADYRSADARAAARRPRAATAQGLLLIGEPPAGFGVAVLPGNNFHVFDYALFWANVRADAARRLGRVHIADDHRRRALDFRDALPDGGRLAGLDVGTKTIGARLLRRRVDDRHARRDDPPHQVQRRSRRARPRSRRRRSIRGLVIGLPLNMDGSDSPRTQAVRAFARNLAPLALPILLWDERWSTAAVTRTLIAADASRARARRTGRQDGRRLHPAGRDRRAGRRLTGGEAGCRS